MGKLTEFGSGDVVKVAVGPDAIHAYAEQMNSRYQNGPVRWSVGPGTNEAGEKVQHLLHVTWKKTGMKAW